MEKSLSIIIPSHNDAAGLQTFLPELIKVCSEHYWRIFVVDDCSKDETASFLAAFGEDVSVITNEQNLGYGASIKRGILAASTEWIATMDADGQHRVDDLERLATLAKSNCDAIIGKRRKTSHAPFSRQPGKWILKYAANFITGQKISDINCGLRILRRDIMLRLLSITSDRFSFSTSTAICLLQLGCRVKFAPVTVEERIGKSNVRQIKDGFYTLLLMTRLVFLFKPLRIILPAGLICVALACLNQIITFYNKGFDISDATVLLGLSGLIMCFMALVGDQVSGLRRDILLHDLKLEQLRTDYCKPIEKE
jgi:glycosyltransferase involved in cell wall biosynthesis